MASTEEYDVARVGVSSTGDVLVSLLRAGRGASAVQLPHVVEEHARRLGVGRTRIWLVDHGQRRLMRAATPPLGPDILPIDDGSPAGEAFTRIRPAYDESAVWLPLTAGAERLGVLEVATGGAAVPPDLDALALLVGELVATKSLYSDDYFRLRRRERMSLEAELQWSLLPPLNVHCGGTSLAGLLEPAYDVGGDVFDHALNGDVLHLAVFDAVGHDVRASIVSHVVVGTYRHARRLGNSLSTTASIIDAALASYVGDSHFATGVLAQLDCRTGELQWLGVGHPTPLLTRRDQVVQLTSPASHPLGLGIGTVEPQSVRLQPGDRVLFYTDGIIDERIWDDHVAAMDWLGRQLIEAGDSGTELEETLRALMLATIDRWPGRQGDDATLLLLEWSPD